MKISFLHVLSVVFLLTLASACSNGQPMCTPGANTCACKANDVCDTGLVCSAAKTCGAGAKVGLQISDTAARGCEILLTSSAGTAIKNLTFQDGVVGTFVNEAPRTAVSFVAPKDAALPGSGVRLVVSGPMAGVSVTKSSCVDAKGVKLPGAAVTLK